MSRAATSALRAHCSQQAITDRLRKFLIQLGYADASGRAPSLPARLGYRMLGLGLRHCFRT
jgi:hypothetical protein